MKRTAEDKDFVPPLDPANQAEGEGDLEDQIDEEGDGDIESASRSNSKWKWTTRTTLDWIEAMIKFMPEAAAYGKGAEMWRQVHAFVQNTTGKTVAEQTLRNQVKKQRTAFKKFEDLTTKSGQDQAVVDVMEQWREYESQLENRKKLNDEEKVKADEAARAGETMRANALKRMSEKSPTTTPKGDSKGPTSSDNSSSSGSPTIGASSQRFKDSFSLDSLAESEVEVVKVKREIKFKELEFQEKKMQLELERYQIEANERKSEREETRRRDEADREERRRLEEMRARADEERRRFEDERRRQERQEDRERMEMFMKFLMEKK